MTLSSRLQPETRSAYPYFKSIGTRWSDNDAYGHVNNVVYYSWFDTVVNAWLIEVGALDPMRSAVLGLVVDTQCSYFAPLSFPEPVVAGLRVGHVGRSSVRYELALFPADPSQRCAARGHFVHVYVDRATRRPTPLPDTLVSLLETLTHVTAS
ncbi:MAG: acyl-CoA thioesterase [Polaromonas sp.]|nr:acyl-CoA thioesterase [Polaromonas sp.]